VHHNLWPAASPVIAPYSPVSNSSDTRHRGPDIGRRRGIARRFGSGDDVIEHLSELAAPRAIVELGVGDLNDDVVSGAA